jgi:hypothetical protein
VEWPVYTEGRMATFIFIAIWVIHQLASLAHAMKSGFDQQNKMYTHEVKRHVIGMKTTAVDQC